MQIEKIMQLIHEAGIENEIFELLTQWMISDRYEKMKRVGECESTLKAIRKIATQNKNKSEALQGIICLSDER